MIGILYRNEGRLDPNSLKSLVQMLPLFKRNGLIMGAMNNKKRGRVRGDMCHRACQSHQVFTILNGPSKQLSDGVRKWSIIEHLATRQEEVAWGTDGHDGLHLA